MTELFGGIYRGRKVLVTGHTGFKGSWLALWLRELGAEVYGFALPAGEPSHLGLLQLSCRSELGDIRDLDHVKRFVNEAQPEIVFHLAAQPIVRRSYLEPIETYATNVLGSLHVYEACRNAGSVRAIVSITTDKVYENDDQRTAFREDDPLGGYDPYSASKACADIATTSYRRSYWPPSEHGRSHHTLLCSVRAGNVIGGGDWAEDRLVPDLVRAAVAGREAIIRNPQSVRPWQHVLEPLSGYLMLGQALWNGQRELARAFNFGPDLDGLLNVEQVVKALAEVWPHVRHRVERPVDAPHEATALMLDCTLAHEQLGWQPIWDGDRSFVQTALWYRELHEHGEVLSRAQLAAYVAEAHACRLPWTGASA